jgi:hypothetical protein
MKFRAEHTYLGIILLVTPGELHFVPQDAACTFCRLGESEFINNKTANQNKNSQTTTLLQLFQTFFY